MAADPKGRGCLAAELKRLEGEKRGEKPAVDATVEVRIYEFTRRGEDDRWVAGVLFDGRPVSLDCSHLHHTPEAAAKCVRRVERREAQWAHATTEHIGTAGSGAALYEQILDGSTYLRPEQFGSRGIVTRRYTYLDEQS